MKEKQELKSLILAQYNLIYTILDFKSSVTEYATPREIMALRWKMQSSLHNAYLKLNHYKQHYKNYD